MTFRRTDKFWDTCLTLGVMIGCGFLCSTVAGTTGNKTVAPQNPSKIPLFSRQSGLQIVVDTSWAGADGYRPVNVTLTSAKPTTAEVLITIKFTLGGRRDGSTPCVVEKDFALARGTSRWTKTLLVPQLQERVNHCGWQVWVDGVQDMDLSMLANLNTHSDNSMSALICSDADWYNSWGNLSVLPNYLKNYPVETFDIYELRPEDLPKGWLGFSGLSLVAIQANEIETFQQEFPDRLAELLRYVRAGGNLWVFIGGENYSELNALERVLRLQVKSTNEIGSLAARGWRFLALSDEPAIPEDELSKLINPKYAQELELSPHQQAVKRNPARASDSRHWFVARSYGMGTVAVFRTPNSQNQADAMQAVQRSLLSRRLDWANRYGNDPKSGNPQFNDWLIPDVGTAPVFAFQLLISLFVIGIGPLNYWLLKRSNQLPLLLVTIPMASLAATVLLLAYGFFADGIRVRVRARSLTLLDQHAGEAICWTRLSYYAGIAPPDGLQMPLDTAVYPISQERTSRRYGRQYDDSKEILWNESQMLTRGWLGARTPTQYLTIAARPSTKHLLFDRIGEDLVVTNNLGVEIVALAVQGHDRKMYYSSEVAPEASQKLVHGEMRVALKELRQLFTENLPQFPADYDTNRRGRNIRPSRAVTSTNLMEARFKAFVSPVANTWEKGSYVAITRQGAEVALGREDVVESDSFHVIRGTWAP